MPTITPKRLLAALFLAPAVSSAQVDFDWWDFKEWRQIGPRSFLYLGGFTDIFFQDGDWELSPCAFHPSAVIVPPNQFCPLGTTGFIAQGDIDLDGINDEGSFWSIASVNRAEVVEPFRTDQFKIISAPPSGIASLLRASNGDVAEVFDVMDTSVVIWYNVLTPPIDDYEINFFEAHRHYGPGREELDRHYNDVVWGTYQFSLPELNSEFEPPRPVPFAVTHLVTPEAWPGRGAVPDGWHVTNENWFGDELHIDPRTFFRFEWTGLDFQNTIASDLLFFSMRANQYVDPDGITHAEIPPVLLISGTVTGVACNTITTDLDLDALLEQGSTYVLNITSGELNQTFQYPITIFGTGGGLQAGQLVTPEDISAGVVSGSFSGVNGLTLTTDIDLDACLPPNQTYELFFTSGALAGTSQFPIDTWSGMDLTTMDDVSGSVAPGDTFRLEPKDVVSTSTVQGVNGFFIQGDRDLTNLIPGGDYRIEITSGAMAGATVPLRNWGFPNNFYFETQQDISASLGVGDTYQLRLFDPPANRLRIGDEISISQTFTDLLIDKHNAGEVLAVDEETLLLVYNINPTADLEVEPGLYAVAREDLPVFPPYPIQTPPGDRQDFLLGVFEDQYELGPFFFRPGDSATGRLNLDRATASGSLTTDNVNRIINYRVRFIDTYDGFAILGGLSGDGFPFGTPSSLRAPNLDFDRDGASNVLEFALNTDVADPNDSPTFQYALDVATGQCTATLTKRPFVGERLLYFFEYSTDLVNWTTIRRGDPNFDIVIDNDTTLTVENIADLNGALPAPSCFLRVKVVLN